MAYIDSYSSFEFTNFIFEKGFFPLKSSFSNKLGIFTLFLKSNEYKKNQKPEKAHTSKKNNQPTPPKNKNIPNPSNLQREVLPYQKGVIH